jgi:hypothetical protein
VGITFTHDGNGAASRRDASSTVVHLDDEGLRKHVEYTVRAWLGLPASSQHAVPELPEELARVLLRVEEYEQRYRDEGDRWEFSYSDNFHRGQLWVPEVDVWVARERKMLAQHLPLEPLWPDAREFAVCLTHDVDMVSRQATARQILRAIRAGTSMPGASGRPEREWAARSLARAFRFGIGRTPSSRDSLERCLVIERESGVTSSYFFAVYPPPRMSPYDCVYASRDLCLFHGRRRRVGDVIREIAAEGFDVGLHGSFSSALDGTALRDEKEALEAVIGRPIHTTRQHFLHWDVRRTPVLQDEAGFAADTTLGFNRNVGFRAGTSLPFHMFDLATGRRLRLLEVPLVVQEGALVVAPHGLDVAPAIARSIVARIIDAVAEVQGVVTLLFHPHSLVRSDVADLYRWCLDCVRDRGAWLTSLSEIEKWWRLRELRLGIE